MAIQSKTTVSPTPWHLWALGALMSVWQFFTTGDFVLTYTAKYHWLTLTMSDSEIKLFNSVPFWTIICWALNIWPNTIGIVLLFLRSKLAVWAFLIGFIAILPLWPYNFLFTSNGVTYGFWNGFMWQLGLTLQGLVGFLYARAMTRRGVLR